MKNIVVFWVAGPAAEKRLVRLSRVRVLLSLTCETGKRLFSLSSSIVCLLHTSFRTRKQPERCRGEEILYLALIGGRKLSCSCELCHFFPFFLPFCLIWCLLVLHYEKCNLFVSWNGSSMWGYWCSWCFAFTVSPVWWRHCIDAVWFGSHWLHVQVFFMQNVHYLTNNKHWGKKTSSWCYVRERERERENVWLLK